MADSLTGPRVLLRPLVPADCTEWQEVRRANADWLLKWEPLRAPGAPDPTRNKEAFAARCGARQRERQLGTGCAYGIFVGGALVGEMNLSIVQRGAFQSCYVGYWIAEAQAGRGYIPEALVLLFRSAFEDLRLHRVQISVIPRNTASRRVMEKLAIRDEGLAERYLEINGTWEDHIRYAITVEEWERRREELVGDWLA